VAEAEEIRPHCGAVLSEGEKLVFARWIVAEGASSSRGLWGSPINHAPRRLLLLVWGGRWTGLWGTGKWCVDPWVGCLPQWNLPLIYHTLSLSLALLALPLAILSHPSRSAPSRSAQNLEAALAALF
jgi:predicted dienelactone hydrolase